MQWNRAFPITVSGKREVVGIWQEGVPPGGVDWEVYVPSPVEYSLKQELTCNARGKGSRGDGHQARDTGACTPPGKKVGPSLPHP